MYGGRSGGGGGGVHNSFTAAQIQLIISTVWFGEGSRTQASSAKTRGEHDDIVGVISLFCKPLVKAQLRLKAIKAIISAAGAPAEDGQRSHSSSLTNFQTLP